MGAAWQRGGQGRRRKEYARRSADLLTREEDDMRKMQETGATRRRGIRSMGTVKSERWNAMEWRGNHSRQRISPVSVYKASIFPSLDLSGDDNRAATFPPGTRILLARDFSMDASTFISISVRSPTFYHRPPPLRGGSRGEVSSLLTPEEELTVCNTVRYRNRFLYFLRLGSVVDNMDDPFFKSEIRRRLIATSLLIVISRVGYFIPLPGFDRRLMPQDNLSFASGSTDELGDFSAELKLSLFQLGISPQIAASILMQVPVFLLFMRISNSHLTEMVVY
ncbi:hypothetical protein KSP40_PGU020570 [Platanthera guangdongensis]|uniref:Uncharacterized protein n=1 Tax=Platanthera guangdongensis TaxID=2320717 RepID=A0ABR2MB92_9ASPA